MQKGDNALLAVAAAGGLMAANAAVVGGEMFFDSRPFAELAREPAHVLFHGVLLVVLVGLAVALPHLRRVRGRDGRAIPAGLLAFVVIGVVMNAGTAWAQTFVVPFIATNEPALLSEDVSRGLLMPAMIGAWALYGMGLAALGVSGIRRKVFPTPVGALLVFGGLSAPVLGPLSGVPAGIALAWGGMTGRRHRGHDLLPGAAQPA